MTIIKYRDIKGDTALDRILRAWIGHDLDNLSDKDKNILQRITEVDKRLQEGTLVKGRKGSFSRPIRLKELAEWHRERFGVSLRQAYEDIAMAKQFFLSTETREDKESARGKMIQQCEELMAEAASQSDFKAAAAFCKELRLLRGLDKVDADTPNLSQWEPVLPRIIVDPSEIGFEKIDNPNEVVERLLKSFKKGPIDNLLDDSQTDFEEVYSE